MGDSEAHPIFSKSNLKWRFVSDRNPLQTGSTHTHRSAGCSRCALASCFSKTGSLYPEWWNRVSCKDPSLPQKRNWNPPKTGGVFLASRKKHAKRAPKTDTPTCRLVRSLRKSSISVTGIVKRILRSAAFGGWPNSRAQLRVWSTQKNTEATPGESPELSSAMLPPSKRIIILINLLIEREQTFTSVWRGCHSAVPSCKHVMPHVAGGKLHADRVQGKLQSGQVFGRICFGAGVCLGVRV